MAKIFCYEKTDIETRTIYNRRLKSTGIRIFQVKRLLNTYIILFWKTGNLGNCFLIFVSNTIILINNSNNNIIVYFVVYYEQQVIIYIAG